MFDAVEQLQSEDQGEDAIVKCIPGKRRDVGEVSLRKWTCGECAIVILDGNDRAVGE